MDFSQLEEQDGVRLTWNVWPRDKIDVSARLFFHSGSSDPSLQGAKCVIPFAAFYTPNKRLATMPVGQISWRSRLFPLLILSRSL